MMILILLCLVITEFFIYRELKKFNLNIINHILQKEDKAPPKPRGSFVVKRMEERLKEALYK